MRIPITMGTLGYDMTTGRIARWMKAVGDQVERGEPIAEIETDKVTVDLESPAPGRLVELVHEAGDDVPIGEIIGYLEA
jgi:pyruvate/2-oxoglutarate dehydrogenase complex dihydrolipoamide acyltransferase (E2) component